MGQAVALRNGYRDLLGEIAQHIPSFHASEQAIARVILSSPNEVSRMNISQLAEFSQTSVASVVRFSKTIGFKGFPEFRMALVGELSRLDVQEINSIELDGGITPRDTHLEIIRKITKADALAIQSTAERLDVKTFSEIVELWDKADAIGIVGIVSGSYVAMDLQAKLNRQGKKAFAWSDAHSALTSIALLNKGDVLVAISHSGSTQDIVDVLKSFKDRGITTVLITNALRSPAGLLADHVLHTSARETTFRSGATASRIAQLTVVDCLCVALAQRNWRSTKAALDTSRAAVRNRSGQKANEQEGVQSQNSSRSRGGK